MGPGDLEGAQKHFLRYLYINNHNTTRAAVPAVPATCPFALAETAHVGVRVPPPRCRGSARPAATSATRFGHIQRQRPITVFVDRWCHAPGTGVGAAYVSASAARGVRNAAAVTGGGAQYFSRR